MARTEYINLMTGEPAWDLSGWPKNGTQVEFIGKNGYEYQLNKALETFKVGQVLTIKDCVVSSSSSIYEFEEVPGTWNTVMFRTIHPNELYNTKYNPAGEYVRNTYFTDEDK